MNTSKLEVGGDSGIKEPIHMMAVRWPVYAGAVVLSVGPIAPGAGLTAALVGITAGLWVGRFLAVSQFRGLAIALASCVLFGLAQASDRILGGSVLVAGMLGYRGTLQLVEVVTFGLTAFSLTAGIRAIATRHRAWCWLEAATVAMIVVGSFSGHRDMHFGRPQYLSDWALSHQMAPIDVLVWIGVGTAFSCLLLLLRPQPARRTLVSVLVLIGLVSLILVIGARLLPGPGPDDPHKPLPPPPPGPGPVPVPPPPPSDTPKPLAIVNFRDDLDPTLRRLYFRDEAQSAIDGVRLGYAGPAYDQEVPHGHPSSRTVLAIENLPTDNAVFEEIGQRISTLVELPNAIGMVTAGLIQPTKVADAKIFARTYHVNSRVCLKPLNELARTKVGNPSWSDEVRDHYLALPSDPRYKAKAEQIIESALKPEYRDSPASMAMALADWIKNNTVYTKYPKPSADVTAAFLFDGEPGKCAEVAHSMVFMLRSLGVPARASTGFTVPRSRLGTGSAVLIQDSDAHQWCEVYFEGFGWVIVDTSPKKSITPHDPEPDPRTQEYFADKNREPEERVTEEIRHAEQAARSLGITRAAWLILGFTPACLLALAHGIKLWRRLAPRWVSASRLDRAGYRAVLDRLAEVGLSRQYGETRTEFASRVGRIIPDFIEATAAFDRQSMTGEGGLDRADWLELGSRISSQVASEFPRKRRLLGLANPLSWRMAR